MVEIGGDPGMPFGGSECLPAPSGPGLAPSKYLLTK